MALLTNQSTQTWIRRSEEETSSWSTNSLLLLWNSNSQLVTPWILESLAWILGINPWHESWIGPALLIGKNAIFSFFYNIKLKFNLSQFESEYDFEQLFWFDFRRKLWFHSISCFLSKNLSNIYFTIKNMSENHSRINRKCIRFLHLKISKFWG